MLSKIMVRGFLAAALVAAALTARANVFSLGGSDTSMSFVTVGDPGNLADPITDEGNVSYTYKIGADDVTSAQYAQFLNAVATTSDPYGLYNSNMANAPSQGPTS